MANSGKQSPLGVNVLGSLMANRGFRINPVAAAIMGSSKTNASYTPGSAVTDTVLNFLTQAIHLGYAAYNSGYLSSTTYNNLISIGSNTIPALGNSKPATYDVTDPAGIWTTSAVAYGVQQGIAGALPGPATSGYGTTSDTGQGQEATWYPYNTTNPNHSITQWGWIRCHALQAWNEFNWNATDVSATTPAYKEFCNSFITAFSTVNAANQSINAVNNADNFLTGAYSNMNDLISADIAGVSLSTVDFGTDLENLGKAIDLKQIETFGLPSNLLRTLSKNLAITSDLSLALLAAGLTSSEIANITGGVTPNLSKQKEQQIYGAFLIIQGENLAHILAPLQCKTSGFNSLADLLNLRKLFPISYASLTVPIYNATPGPTNSKTYYLIYQDGGVNLALDAPAIKSYVGTIIPKGRPPIFEKTVSPANFVQLPTGFGSYLDGIIPYDQSIAAGAFSYTMRQIRNIQVVDTEKFAKVAKGIENTEGLGLIAGTNKPTDQDAVDYAIEQQALGTGPYGTLTMSDFFGSMSGLPYPWKKIVQRIKECQTTNLATIYSNLYTTINSYTPPGDLNTPVQAYIDQANAEIAAILTSMPMQARYLNTYWDILGTQLKIEQRTRYSYIPPVPVPKDLFLSSYLSAATTFVDSIPQMSQDTRPHMAAQTLEAVADLSDLGGQSIVGQMRQERNQIRLQKIGIELDNNIPDYLPNTVERALLANGTVPGARAGITNANGTYTLPAWPETIDENGQEVAPTPLGVYTPPFQYIAGVADGDITPILDNATTPVVSTIVPSGPVIVNSSPIDNIVIIKPAAEYDPNNLPPNLDPAYLRSTTLPSTPNINMAIQQVIACNCDCWV
jgi:hypothetical protein